MGTVRAEVLEVMICPRCSAGEISETTDQCVVCGFAPLGSLVVGKPVVDEVRETVQREVQGLFHIDRLLHHGNRSVVYEARVAGTAERVALKAIPLQMGLQVDVAEFERRADLAVSLSHSHLARLLDFGHTGALLWYSSELVGGGSLHDLLVDAGYVTKEKCLQIAEQVASALDYLHRRGVVHGNVKPRNILLDERGWVRLADAWVMSAFASDGTGGGLRVEEAYRAPECVRGRGASPSADQFSLAAVARRIALEADGRGRAAGLAQCFEAAVCRALAPTPDRRFPSVLDFATALRGDMAPTGSQFLVPDGRPRHSDILLIDPPDSGQHLPAVKIAVSVLIVFAVVFLAGVVWLRPPLWASLLGP
ncbi:MAG: serine/threonine-protein kinase [Gemmatimonadales bacterium]